MFGSDQGLVGRFNDALAAFVQSSFKQITGAKDIWIVGERMVPSFTEKNVMAEKIFVVPNSVDGISPLVNKILANIEEAHEQKTLQSVYLYHNAPVKGAGYESGMQRLLPLTSEWQKNISITSWPNKNQPQVIGGDDKIFPALIREYLFVSIYKTCAESLASENESRLEAMQRAEKSISEMLDGLNLTYNRLRQTIIDEELFDLVAGFEALKDN